MPFELEVAVGALGFPMVLESKLGAKYLHGYVALDFGIGVEFQFYARGRKIRA